MLWTWQNHDVSANNEFQRNFESALKSLNMPVWIIPSSTDLYFHPKDSENEGKLIKYSKYIEIPSDYGHIAGGPNRVKEDTIFVEKIISEVLSTK